MVKIYSTPVCPECAKLKRFLNEKGVEFEEINVLEDREAADFIEAKTGMRRVPVFQVDELLIVGFNKTDIEKILNNLSK